MAACAVTALATVFSVQQGEHGPLVVYKLQVPERSAATVQPLPPAMPEPVTVIPSRAPSVLGTVVIPSDSAPLPSAEALPAASLAAPPAGDAPGVPEHAEGLITLQEVSDEVMWRRNTVERLPQAPFAPRF